MQKAMLTKPGSVDASHNQERCDCFFVHHDECTLNILCDTHFSLLFFVLPHPLPSSLSSLILPISTHYTTVPDGLLVVE